MRIAFLATTCLTLGALVLPAQQSHDAAGARLALITLLHQEEPGQDSLRVADDSVALWRNFVTCGSTPSGVACTLRGGKPVLLVSLRMVSADSAEATVTRFRMVSARCPSGEPIDPPVIVGGRVGREGWFLGYHGGRWIGTKSDQVVTC